MCAASFDPVCGSDGKTYSNECEAKSAGATPVKYKGSCAVTNICDKKLFDPMQACRDQGKSYTFESDKNGCPIAGTTKCTEFQHRCPVAFVGLEEEKRMCEKAGGTYKPDTDPFGCTHGRCDGATKIVCPPQPTEDVRKSMEATCIKYGGTFSTKTESGCTFPDCMFPSDNLDLDNPFGRLTCPTNIDLERQTRPCEALNQNTGNRFIAGNRYVGGCQLVECVRDEEKCILDPTLEQSIANTCAEQKKDVVNKFDSKGCTYSICGDISECDKEAPKTVVDKCEAKGGEFKVEKDDVSGCVKFAHCIEPGLRPEDVVVEPVRTIPDTIILLDLVLKLDTLKITLDKLALKAQDLAAYYQAAGNTGEQDKFERVADLLSTAKDKIDEVKDKIREKLDTITIAELTEIKTDLVVLKDSLLREVLYLLLGKKTDSSDLTTLKDCGSDPACFDSRYRNCAPTTFTPPVPSGSSPTVKIEGLVDGKCSMTASMAVEGTAYDMKCSIADYGLGIHDPEDLIQHCTGNMADLIKSGYFGSTSAESQAPAEIQTTSPQPTQPTSQTAASSPAATASPASARITGQIIAGGTASANTNSVLSISRLSHDSSGVGEYKISVADKDGVNFVAIKKSGGIAVGSGEAGGCSTGFNLQDTFVLSPPDFPLTASVRDCTNPLSTYNIQIKMPPL